MMFVSSACALATALVLAAAMPPPPAGDMPESMRLCGSALVTKPSGSDLPIMKTCCSTETQLSEGQCEQLLAMMSQGPGDMKQKTGGGVMMKLEPVPMTTESMPVPVPEPEARGEGKNSSSHGTMEMKEMKSVEKSMEKKMSSMESMEEDAEDENTTLSVMGEHKGNNTVTMEMMAAEPIIMQCFMKNVGFISADGVVNEGTVRKVWNTRVEPSAGELEKKKLIAALDTCPLSTKHELMMFPTCLVKTCSVTAQ